MPDQDAVLEASPRIVTRRAAVVGLVLSVIAGVGGQYLANTFVALNIAYAHLPVCLLIPFLVLILGPNVAMKARVPRHALTPPELLVIFSMGLIGSTVPDWAMNWYLMSAITAPRYFASPENQWQDKFFDYLPDWLVLERHVAQGFYEGIPPGQPIPWLGWVIPLFWWFSLIAALMFVGACLVVMLRKQWTEHEKLRFPLGEISLHLTGAVREANETSAASPWPLFFRTHIFRVGLLITLSVTTYNCVTYWSGWPRVPIMGPDAFWITFGPAYPGLPIRLNVFSLCFAFFINVEILFSLWVFQLFGILQEGFLNRIGMNTPSLLRGGLVSIQFIGGMIFFVLWGLWMARRHLREVVRHAFGRSTTLDDRDELFSYRLAVFGLVLGFVYIIFWLNRAGVSIPVALLFLFFLFVFYLALARILAETGLVMLDLPINAHEFTVSMLGSANISHATLTGLTLTNAFARNWRTFTMIATAHIAWFRDYLKVDLRERRITDGKAEKPHETDRNKHNISPASSAPSSCIPSTGRNAPLRFALSNLFRKDRKNHSRQPFFLWICLAFGTSAVSSLIYFIYDGYTYGAQNLRAGAVGSLGNGFYAMAVNWIDNATQITEREVMFLGMGGLITFLLIIARYFLYWWPLHPIGFVVAASEPVRIAFLPLLMAWIIQVVLLRIGGVRLYRSVQPFFLGMLVGYILGAGLSFFVDFVWFPGRPHLFENIFI